MANPFMPLVWSHLGRRKRRPWWFAPLRFNRQRSTFFVYTGRLYAECYRKGPGEKWATLCWVGRLPPGVPCTSVEWEKQIMGFFDKLPSSDNGQLSAQLPADEKFQKKYPALWTYLTALEYEPGKPRERSSLMTFIEEGVFKLCLTERTKECSCWATGPTFEKALDALEARITSAAPEWRSSGKKKGKK